VNCLNILIDFCHSRTQKIRYLFWGKMRLIRRDFVKKWSCTVRAFTQAIYKIFQWFLFVFWRVFATKMAAVLDKISHENVIRFY
jgi:hypothetical protein